MGWRHLAILATLLVAGCAAPDPEPQALEAAPAEPILAPLESTLAPAPASTPQDERLPPGLYALELPVAGGLATGLVAVPHGEPQALVAVAHGWGAEARSHRRDLQAIADGGALALAMDYRGPQGAFKVQAGVEDTVAATLAMQRLHPDVHLTMLYGWSMGGEVALLSVVAAPPGTYDYVFSSAGVMDLASFWHEEPLARAAIENETGGPPTEVPAAYESRSPVLHAQAIAAAGVRRVFLLHGAGDWIVPVEHAERGYQALADAGQPVSYYAVTKDESGACAAELCLSFETAAGHDAGRYELVRPLVEHRLDGLPDPDEAAVRGTYDAATGKYDPSDVG